MIVSTGNETIENYCKVMKTVQKIHIYIYIYMYVYKYILFILHFFQNFDRMYFNFFVEVIGKTRLVLTNFFMLFIISKKK